MVKYSGIPDMLEMYMAEPGSTERWITVGQLRQRFGFSRKQCTGVSRFLRRLHEGAYRQFPYIVQRIERDPGCKPQETGVLRYLIRQRDCIMVLHEHVGQEK